MTKNLTTNLFVVLAAATSFVGCSTYVGPTGPSHVVSSGLQGGFELRGSVSGQADPDGRGIDGVTVMVSNGSLEVSTVTDEGGNFVVTDLTAGDWTIAFSKPGYADQTMQVSIQGDTDISCSLDRDLAAATAGRSARIRK